MAEIGYGLIGTGFMGRAHAYAYRAAPAVFPDIPRVRLRGVAEPMATCERRLDDVRVLRIALNSDRDVQYFAFSGSSQQTHTFGHRFLEITGIYNRTKAVTG